VTTRRLRSRRFYYDYDSFQETQFRPRSTRRKSQSRGYYNIIVKSAPTSTRCSAYYFENSKLVADNLTSALKDQGVSAAAASTSFRLDRSARRPAGSGQGPIFTSWRDWRIHRNVVDFPTSENTACLRLGNVTISSIPAAA